MDLTLTHIAYVLGVYLLAGIVKGVVGLGLPTISLVLVVAIFGLKEAMVLLLVPSLVTNLWQGIFGGQLITLLHRIWPMLAALSVVTWFTTGIMFKSDAGLLSIALGLVLLFYAGVSLATPQIPKPGRREVWMSPLVGALTGVSTGFTGTFVVPGVLFLQALRLGKDGFVQAMGICFTTATLALGVSLAVRGYMPADLGLLSIASVIPAILGMIFGQKVREKISETKFRRVFFATLLFLGAWMIVRPVVI